MPRLSPYACVSACQGADVNLANKRGSTSLLFSVYAERASPSLVKLFVDAGADPARCDEDGVGALHIAAIKVRALAWGTVVGYDTAVAE